MNRFGLLGIGWISGTGRNKYDTHPLLEVCSVSNLNGATCLQRRTESVNIKFQHVEHLPCCIPMLDESSEHGNTARSVEEISNSENKPHIWSDDSSLKRHH